MKIGIVREERAATQMAATIALQVRECIRPQMTQMAQMGAMGIVSTKTER